MSQKRSTVSLLTAFSFVVLAVTGVLAFIRPFSIQIVGLHALIGFVFIGLIALHIFNNTGHLGRYLKRGPVWVTLGVIVLLACLFFWQPAPIKSVLGLSQNMGPDLDQYEVTDLGMSYRYVPDPGYKMGLTVRSGTGFHSESPPHFAIWLENASQYHIKTLHTPTGEQSRSALPYWDFKRRGWEEARLQAETSGKDLLEELEIDAISGATENSSFDPADYILPGNAEDSLPYRLLLEINQPGDDQASLVYAVDIDNINPRTFQLLDLVGYPKREEDDDEGKEIWALYYVDDSFTSALELIDSALLTIERAEATQVPEME
jgi:hypothetical protein